MSLPSPIRRPLFALPLLLATLAFASCAVHTQTLYIENPLAPSERAELLQIVTRVAAKHGFSRDRALERPIGLQHTRRGDIIASRTAFTAPLPYGHSMHLFVDTAKAGYMECSVTDPTGIRTRGMRAQLLEELKTEVRISAGWGRVKIVEDLPPPKPKRED